MKIKILNINCGAGIEKSKFGCTVQLRCKWISGFDLTRMPNLNKTNVEKFLTEMEFQFIKRVDDQAVRVGCEIVKVKIVIEEISHIIICYHPNNLFLRKALN